MGVGGCKNSRQPRSKNLNVFFMILIIYSRWLSLFNTSKVSLQSEFLWVSYLQLLGAWAFWATYRDLCLHFYNLFESIWHWISNIVNKYLVLCLWIMASLGGHLPWVFLSNLLNFRFVWNLGLSEVISNSLYRFSLFVGTKWGLLEEFTKNTS